MAIEFGCSGCQKTLRVAEAAGGKQARCPGCGTIVVVPYATGTPPGGMAPSGPGSLPRAQPMSAAGMPSQGPAMPPPRPAAQQPVGDLFAHQQAAGGYAPHAASPNPFQSPQSSAYVAPRATAGRKQIVPTRIDFGDIFSMTWKLFSENALNCILVNLIPGFAIIAAVVLFLIIFVTAHSIIGEAAFILLIPAGPAFFALIVWLMCGAIKFNLKVARGERAEIADLFTGGPYIVSAILSGLLMWLIFMGAIIAAEVPIALLGFLAALAIGPKALVLIILVYPVALAAAVTASIVFGEHMYLIVDQNMGTIDSFQGSMKVTAGNRLMIALIYVVMVFGGAIASGCTLGLGNLVVVPFANLLGAVMFLAMTGQYAEAIEGPMPMLMPLRQPKSIIRLRKLLA